MAKPSTFIKLNRSILDWEWYSDHNVKDVFLHLLLTANYEASSYRGIEVERGQCVVTVAELERTLKLSTQQIRTALSKLKSTNEITIKSYTKFQVITIVSYDKYQGSSTNKSTDEQQTNNKQITNKQQHQKNIRNKEYNNIYIYNNSNELFPQSDFSNLPALPLNDGTDYCLTVSEVDEYKMIYPGIDVEQQVREMYGWLVANPKNRKTRNGIKRFINSWLSREQNRAPRVQGGSHSTNSVEDVLRQVKEMERMAEYQ